MNKQELIEFYRSMGWELREEQMTPEELKLLDFSLRVDVSNGKVRCDACNEDYTDSKECGGITLGSWAICPKCTPRYEASAKKYNEEHAIKYRCPEGMSYADWVRDVLRKKHESEGLTTTLIVSSKE